MYIIPPRDLILVLSDKKEKRYIKDRFHYYLNGKLYYLIIIPYNNENFISNDTDHTVVKHDCSKEACIESDDYFRKSQPMDIAIKASTVLNYWKFRVPFTIGMRLSYEQELEAQTIELENEKV